jgi:hypothetical protein
VSEALNEYMSAFHDAILAVLGVLTAERRLSDEHSSALAVGESEDAADRAAARLAVALDALPLSYWPVGWHEPPAVAGDVRIARHRLIRAGLRCLAAEYADESADADSEYAREQMCHAARNLAADVAARAARETPERNAASPEAEIPGSGEGRPCPR